MQCNCTHVQFHGQVVASFIKSVTYIHTYIHTYTVAVGPVKSLETGIFTTQWRLQVHKLEGKLEMKKNGARWADAEVLGTLVLSDQSTQQSVFNRRTMGFHRTCILMKMLS